MKKLISAALSLIIVLGLFAGCSGGPGTSDSAEVPKNKSYIVGGIPSSFPLVSEPETLKVITTGYNSSNQDDVYVWKRYEEMTGVDIEWDNFSRDTRSEKVNNALINHQQYDLIIRCKISATKLQKYGESGLILDLAKDGMLEKYAPNCWAYLQSHPDTLSSVKNPDGTIYSLPQVNSGAELRVAQKMFINKQWLERVNMELPTTTEELRQLLLAFKNQDANGDGDPDNEIPLCSNWDAVKMALYGSFGLANRGFHNETFDCDPVTGNVRLIERSTQYKSFLEYMKNLYTGGLLDNATFKMSSEQMFGTIATGRVGVFVNTNLALLPADQADNWVALDTALTGPDGDKLWSAIRANFHSTGAAVIPATCTNPELVLRWLDYFWTDEGTLFYHMGENGKTYTELDDGTYDYLPKIYEEMSKNNLSFDDEISKYSPYPGGSNPTVETAPYFKGGEMAAEPARAARALMAYGPDEYWSSFTYTEEETNRMDSIKVDMRKYIDSMRTDFITGAKSLDDWDSYTAQLDKMGAADLQSIYQSAVDRYHALIAALE